MPDRIREKFLTDPLEWSFCLQRMEKLRGDKRAQMKKALTRLRKKNPEPEQLADEMTQMFLSVGMIRGPEEEKHVREDWFRNWYPGQNVAAVLRDGLFQTIVTAGTGDGEMPIASYWIAGAEPKFMAAVARTKYQVTLLLIAPRPATGTELDLSQETKVPVWLMQPSGDGVSVTQLTSAPLLVSTTNAPRPRKKAAKRSRGR